MIWVALAVLIAAPFAREAMRRVPDRATAPGQFARLSQGVTHYQWGGPVRGPVVVAIHGCWSMICLVVGFRMRCRGRRIARSSCAS